MHEVRAEQAVAEHFEAVLAREGLPAEPGPSDWSSNHRRLVLPDQGIEHAMTAVEAWQAWAADITRTYPFRNRAQREVWELYAQGVPMRDIPKRRGTGSFRDAKRTVAAIKRKSPPGPPNPWRRAPTVESTTQDERTSMPIRTLHYTKIALHRPIQLPPGSPPPFNKMVTDVFNDVDGTPHAGGIDIEVGDSMVLVTWTNVKAATRKTAEVAV